MATEEQDPLERTNKKLASITALLTNVKALAVAALPIAAVIYLLASGQGAALWQRWVADATGVEPVTVEPVAEFTAVPDRWHAPYLVIEDRLREEGLEPEIEEFTTQTLSEHESRVRWRREDKQRTYHLSQDSHGVWLYQRED